jgi:hypothetical protein
LDAASLRRLMRPGLSVGVPEGPVTGEMVRQAEAEAGTAWPAAPAHAWARFRLDGDRREYETEQFARTYRLTRAVVAALVDPSAAALAEVLDGVVLLCEQSSWCWPAHDDSWTVREEVLPNVGRPYVDLGAGETLCQLAWVDAAVGGVLDRRYPGIRRRIRDEAARRVFDPFLARRDWGWLTGQPNNWNPWIHGNVIAGALQLVDDPRRRAEVVLACVEGLDKYVAALPDDGACDEGHAYWWQGPGRLLEVLGLLSDATGGHLDAFGLPGVRATVDFPCRMYLGHGWYVNYGDATARPMGEQPWYVLFRVARAVEDEAAMAFAVAEAGSTDIRVEDGLGRVLRALADPQWRARMSVEPIPPPADACYESIGLFVARESGGLAVSAKGGHNGENHNHCDVGSVIVALDGVPVVVDAGRMTYTAATFGPDRYTLWPMRSAWHNVPLIDGEEQGVGAAFRARGVRMRPGLDESSITMELGDAYPVGRRLTRTVCLDRLRERVEIVDEWADGTRVEERFLVAGRVVSVRPGLLVIVSLGGGELRLCWPTWVPFSLVPQLVDDPTLASVWGERLTQLRLWPRAVYRILVVVSRVDHNGSRPPQGGSVDGGAPSEGSANHGR